MNLCKISRILIFIRRLRWDGCLLCNMAAVQLPGFKYTVATDTITKYQMIPPGGGRRLSAGRRQADRSI
jgi:hypothetical protein